MVTLIFYLQTSVRHLKLSSKRVCTKFELSAAFHSPFSVLDRRTDELKTKAQLY